MMLTQHITSPPEPPPPPSSLPPPSTTLPFNARINNEAPPSILQLNKSAWRTALQTQSPTSFPLTPTISASSSSATTTTTSTSTQQPELSSSASSHPSSSSSTNAERKPPNHRAFTLRPATPQHAAQIRHIGATVFANTFGFSIPPGDLADYLASSYSLESITAELASRDCRFIVAVAPVKVDAVGRGERGERSAEVDADTDGDGDADADGYRGRIEDGDEDEEMADVETKGEGEEEAAVPKEERIIGFAQITQHTTEPCLSHIPQDELIELQRLYVLPEYQNLGVGRALLEAAEGVAREVVYSRSSSMSRSSSRDRNSAEDDDEDEVGLFAKDRRRRRIRRQRQRTKSARKVNMWLGVWEGNFVAQNVYEKLGYERVGEHEFRMGRCVQIDWVMVKEL